MICLISINKTVKTSQLKIDTLIKSGIICEIIKLVDNGEIETICDLYCRQLKSNCKQDIPLEVTKMIASFIHIRDEILHNECLLIFCYVSHRNIDYNTFNNNKRIITAAIQVLFDPNGRYVEDDEIEKNAICLLGNYAIYHIGIHNQIKTRIFSDKTIRRLLCYFKEKK
eukprot:491086_1